MIQAEELFKRKCVACEGGTPMIGKTQAHDFLKALPGWKLSGSGKAIRREWLMKDFVAAVDLIVRIKDVAEKEDHHPDLHLTGFRNLAVELSTHAIGGLSEHDFILAAKIDRLPKDLKKV
jgi:4a-hydroxytetrahydrobiopterin dehydratase